LRASTREERRQSTPDSGDNPNLLIFRMFCDWHATCYPATDNNNTMDRVRAPEADA